MISTNRAISGRRLLVTFARFPADGDVLGALARVFVDQVGDVLRKILVAERFFAAKAALQNLAIDADCFTFSPCCHRAST
jgi:hypothetical protein